jgi:WD40 repeat protein
MLAQTIAHYRIQAKIGAGGMGEVYRATDTRLSRDVAIKVLPEALARDAERMARFEREAKVLASLNHPNIASIYGIEESNGAHALVMELVEGLTLAERIKQGRLHLDEALPIARQIAEGLEYAHERGIIHRDLKPSNVKLTPDGQVKVLDFGLAKALEGESTEEEIQNSPTLSAAATREGVLLGTAAYMSPEQARGKRVDRRADIWAFGCVLYEMLTGLGPFSGETTSDILACVIRAEPDWSAVPGSVPLRIRELLRRCLQKHPKQRLRDIGEAQVAIEEVLSGSSTAEASLGVALKQQSWHQRIPSVLLAAGFVLVAVGVGLTTRYWHLAPLPGPVSRFAFAIPAPVEQSAVWVVGGFPFADFPDVDVSPDGTEIAYLASDGKTTRVFLRRMDGLEASPLSGTQGALSPFFSPDGQWIGFFADGKLKKVSVRGGEPVTLCEAPINRGASWGRDDLIVFSPTLFAGLMRISANGGSPELLASPDTSKGERSYRWPQILPGGKSVLFVIAEAKDIGFFTHAKIAVERLDTHERKILPIEGTYPRFSPSGHLLFAREGRVFAVQFDAHRLEVTGPAMPVLDGVKTSPNSGETSFTISDTGSLVYLPQSNSGAEGNLVWVDRKNQVQALAAPSRRYSSPAISPDGQRLALSIFSGNNVDIWVYEIPHGTLTRLTYDEKSTAPYGQWTEGKSHSGRRVAQDRKSCRNLRTEVAPSKPWFLD